MSAIKMASEHKVSNSAMNKSHKWSKQKLSKSSNLSTIGTTSIPTSHILSTTSNLQQVYKSPQSVTITTLSNDTCPYQATITTTAINGCKQKESEKNSVIVKSKTPTGDILDLSPNKSSIVSFAFNQSKDVTVICNSTSSDNNSPAKTVRINHV